MSDNCASSLSLHYRKDSGLGESGHGWIDEQGAHGEAGKHGLCMECLGYLGARRGGLGSVVASMGCWRRDLMESLCDIWRGSYELSPGKVLSPID